MVADDWIAKAVKSGKSYEQLPHRIRTSVTMAEWKTKVKEYCIQYGYNWTDTIASTSCFEQEYYEELIEYYKKHERIFPYHLSHFICREMRITPFKYYSDILFNSLKEEKPYDKIPNFTAADILRCLGIGRNEYIATLDSCKAKKFSWRINKGFVREKLPNEPVSMNLLPWWTIGVVNLSEQEYRILSTPELELLQNAANEDNELKISDTQHDTLKSLYRRGLIYIKINIKEDDRFIIPPLEGFISNMTASEGNAVVDPMETLMYSIFVANSETMTVQALSEVLNENVIDIKNAISVACRLGFATRLSKDSDNESNSNMDGFIITAENDDDDSVHNTSRYSDKINGNKQATEFLGRLPSNNINSNGSSTEGQAVAVVVDAETTSYLMMGLLSPGVKKHAVTLFEGGRVAGDEVISDLIKCLRSSVRNSRSMDNEIYNLTLNALSLANILECVKEASGNKSTELLRRESLAGLSTTAIARVLTHSYSAVVPIAPLSGDPLPLFPEQTTPLFFGPISLTAKMWFQLAVYQVVGSGPISYVFTRGKRIQRLPSLLSEYRCQYALLRSFPTSMCPIVISEPFILYYLNEMLKTNPVLLQPLFINPAIAQYQDISKIDDIQFIMVALPLEIIKEQDDYCIVKGFDKLNGIESEIRVSSYIPMALSTLGLTLSVGYLQMIKEDVVINNKEDTMIYVPFDIQMGFPVQPHSLCIEVCRLARERSLFDAALHSDVVNLSRDVRLSKVEKIVSKLSHTIQGKKGNENLLYPIFDFFFDGEKLRKYEEYGIIQCEDVDCLNSASALTE